MSEHRALQNFWARIGEVLGYTPYIEFQVEGTSDRVDVVWEKDGEFIFIEIEQGKVNPQIWKNIYKGQHLKPKFMILDFKNKETYDYFSKDERLPDNVRCIFRGCASFDMYIEEEEELDLPIIAKSIIGREKTVLEILKGLSSKDYNIPFSRAFDEGKSKGISEDVFKDCIEKLKRMGEIFEPRRYFLRVI